MVPGHLRSGLCLVYREDIESNIWLNIPSHLLIVLRQAPPGLLPLARSTIFSQPQLHRYPINLKERCPTFGHKYFDISFIIPQSAFRCSFIVSSASARRGEVGSFNARVFGTATAGIDPFLSRSVVVALLGVEGPFLNIDEDDAKPRAVRIQHGCWIERAGSNVRQRHEVPRVIERRT